MENKFAVIQTGGKQYLVKPGETLKIEKITRPQRLSQPACRAERGGQGVAMAGAEAEKGGEVFFDKVLLMVDSEDIKIGKPYIEGAKVQAKIEEQGRGKKVIVVKYKQKTRYHKKQGHRQPYTKITISDF